MAEQNELKPAVAPLWTRDFTIITLGSIVSMLGNAMSGFALSLLVLDYTDSPLLYAIYIATFTAPQIVAPILTAFPGSAPSTRWTLSPRASTPRRR